MVVHMLVTAMWNVHNKWPCVVLSHFFLDHFYTCENILTHEVTSLKYRESLMVMMGKKNNPLISANFLCSCFFTVRIEIQGETCARSRRGNHENQPKQKEFIETCQSLESFCCLAAVLPAFVTTLPTVLIH